MDGLPRGAYSLLEVSDTGKGMDVKTRARVFEPFFTTKSHGTGLGLSTAFGIVRQSGGCVSVASELGHGAVFSVYLPSVDGPPERPAAAKTSPDATTGNEVVLLVEDEPSVRRATATVLREGGYTVLEASGPGDALLLSEQHAGRVDLLLTDVVMPRMTGVELARRLAAERPEMRVLYMSGYGGTNGMCAEALVQKPVDASSLLTSVRQALDLRAASPACK